MSFDNKDNMDKLLKAVHRSKTVDDFLKDIMGSLRWYLDDRTKLWKKDDFRRFYSQVKEAIGG